jgi:glycosyltransferase involved in cell wall biosynthesis
VIPCLNEARSIGPLVTNVLTHLDMVVVVDDGSTDDTAQNATRAGATLAQHRSPCGKGAALRTGFSLLAEKGFSWALTLDGDGQHDPADIPAFLRRAEETSDGLLVGDRMSNPDGMPAVRRWTNRWMSRYLSKMTGQPLADSQCGFRLLRLDVWKSLDLRTGHFEVESEVLLAFLAAGESVGFVPIRVIYRQERSKIHPIIDSWRWLRWWRNARRVYRPASDPGSARKNGSGKFSTR